MTNTVDTALRADIVGLLGLVQTFNGQLIPENTEDFLSDWTSTVEQLEALISSLTNEAELRGREMELSFVQKQGSVTNHCDDREYQIFKPIIDDRLAALLKLGASYRQPERSQESKPRKEGR